MTLDQRPDSSAILASLKPFQRKTVEHVFRRLWTDRDPVDRFLVADEVGLGKTMIAKGVAAKAIDHLWAEDRPITIAYICSNGQIAKQNLQRLRALTGGEIQDNADRLTMLPATMGRADTERIQLVSLTPGTSFALGRSSGTAQERALLHWMLSQEGVVGPKVARSRTWSSYLAAGAGVDRFRERLTWESSCPDLDPGLLEDFGTAIRVATGPNGGPLLDELEEDIDEWFRRRRGRSPEQKARRGPFISALRMAMANCAVDRLAPDLVILDEFQRFKDLFSASDDDADASQLDAAQRLAHRVITTDRTKVLVLSATPYRMYTLPEEADGEDHYRDFTRMVAFLAGSSSARRVADDLATIRQGILAQDAPGRAAAESATSTVQSELRRVMSRTERLASTPDRDGMLVEKSLGQMRLEPAELEGWLADKALAKHLGSRDVFEYWRATPYAPNLMDKASYQVQQKLLEALDDPDGTDDALVEILRRHRGGLLDWKQVEHYREIDPANAKMRALLSDLEGHEAWKLAWMPPSLPYLRPSGPYAEGTAGSFTKRLVFSAWNVVPKAIAVMLSYQAERHLLGDATSDGRSTRGRSDRAGRSTVPLQFGWDRSGTWAGTAGRPRNLPHLLMLHPSITLARLGDPLALARGSHREEPWDPQELHREVTARIQDRLDHARIETTAPPENNRSWAWYGVAPYVLDRDLLGEDGAFTRRVRSWTTAVSDDDEQATAENGGRKPSQLLADTILAAWHASPEDLGPAPTDLAEVLAWVAISGPGVCALRALARVSGGSAALTSHEVRGAAFQAAMGMRSLFNRPEIVAAVRAATAQDTDGIDAYWRKVLRYSTAGNLQAVLDEYVHTLVESEGLTDAEPAERATAIADVIGGTAAIRTAPNVVHEISAGRSRPVHREHRMNSHLAARFGRDQSQDAAAQREAGVRRGFNSPFWPFVLASTSVGQEGLDFHTYSHAVVHWNLPGNPVDLEQREGRVHRYKGHAVRKNIAAEYRGAAFSSAGDDPWAGMFAAAEASRAPGDDLINPYWVRPTEGGARIERYVPVMPLSREARRYLRLKRTLAAYRLVMGQPRQDDLIEYVGADAEWLRIDLAPPGV